MRWDQVEAATGDAVASGAIVGAVAAVWSDIGHYIGAVGESVAGHPLRIDALFDLASMTKAVTSVAMMQLIERGTLGLDDPAGDYVPYLRDVEVLDGFGDDGSPILRAPTRPVTVRHPHCRLRLRVLQRPDSTTFSPTPGQFERMAIPHVRTEDGLRPETVRIPAPDVEMVSAGGGLFGTVGDYLRFVRMLLGHGSVDGVRILAPDTVDQMCADQFGPPDGGAGRLSWMGALNTFNWIDLSARIVGVYATQVEPFLDPPVLNAFSRFERAVYDTLG